MKSLSSLNTESCARREILVKARTVWQNLSCRAVHAEKSPSRLLQLGKTCLAELYKPLVKALNEHKPKHPCQSSYSLAKILLSGCVSREFLAKALTAWRQNLSCRAVHAETPFSGLLQLFFAFRPDAFPSTLLSFSGQPSRRTCQ